MSDSNDVPQPTSKQPEDTNAAVSLVRAKLSSLYQQEPDAKEELRKAETTPTTRSKHQQFIHELNHSGKSLADIQVTWHEYYAALPDKEKHEVWQEFYSAHTQASQYFQQQSVPAPAKDEATAVTKPKRRTTSKPRTKKPRSPVKTRTEADIKQQLLSKVKQRNRRKLSRWEHFKSLTFGLGMGLLVIFILMFTFFNERFITPFITPSTHVSATPIIVDPTRPNDVGPEAKVIIPKINVDIPVLYNVASIDEVAVQKGLAESVVHYPTTPNPGELGNGAIFGHSSGNIFDRSKAKFAFLQLRELAEGDLFYLNYGGKQYAYKVISKRVVPPTSIEVLTDTLGRPATFTLITCDPPGLNVNRMVITGEQISPAPTANQKSTTAPTTNKAPSSLPGNSESLWHRLTNWLTN